MVAIYKVTKVFPRAEQFGLASHLQRAAVLIPSNIAEGNALRQTKGYLRHIAIACGSLAEVETQLEIAARLGYMDSESTERIVGQATEVGRMLTGLRRSLQAIEQDRRI